MNKNLLAIFVIVIWITACNKSESPEQQATPVITSFTPKKDTTGGQVTIIGTNFNTTVTNNIVKFNGTVASVISASPTKLVVNVPNGVVSGGPITVSILGQTATSFSNFTLLSPNELLVLGKWYYANSIRNDTVIQNGSMIWASSYSYTNLNNNTDYLMFTDSGVVYSFQFAWGIGQSGGKYQDTVNYTVKNNNIFLSYPAGTNNLGNAFNYSSYQDTIAIKSLTSNNFSILRSHHYKHFTFNFGETKQSIDNLIR